MILHLHLRHNLPNNACVARVTRKRRFGRRSKSVGMTAPGPEDRSENLLERRSGAVSSSNLPCESDISLRTCYQGHGGACGFSGASFDALFEKVDKAERSRDRARSRARAITRKRGVERAPRPRVRASLDVYARACIA